MEQRITKEELDSWKEALRSGKYKQTEGVLRHGDRYCCMGVLCVLLGWEPNDTAIIGKGYDFIMIDGVITNNGTDPYSPLLAKVGDTMYKLTSMNDKGATFPQIANIIEMNERLILGKN